jgi:NAD(P)-dependent dehydrogenase (short-subunit alcohol dehydrogenase family)
MKTKRPEKIASERLKGQTALITGASRGIGLAIARALAAQGCNLILTARDQAALTRSSRELARMEVTITAHSCDVRDPQSVDALFRFISRHSKRIDILINNAGIAHANFPVEQLPYPVWKEVMATNLDGMFLVTQSALRTMKRGGTIVNNLSIAATRVFARSSAYNASKHGALGFTNTLREELRAKGIRVIGLLPGATDTDIWKTLWPQAPRRKMMSAASVAQIVVQALLLPSNATVENLEILPSAGTL